MNAATLCLVDPLPAQILLDEQRRHIHRFVGSSTAPLDMFGWHLRLEWRAKSEPVGVGATRGMLGVEHSVEITEIGIASACGRVQPVALDFISRDARQEYATQIEQRLDAAQWEGAGL